MTSVAQVLAKLGLTQYLDRLEAEGFDSWEALLDIQETDFETLNIKLGHRRRIQREIATARGLSAEAALPASQKDSISEDRTPETDERGNLINDNEESRPGQTRTGKRKYVRHPKDDENAPEKAPSAYVLFSNKVREEVKGQDLSFTEIAKLVGQRWQTLSPSDQEPFKKQADTAKERRRVLMEEYKKTEQYEEYERYLADFKAKNNPAPKSDLPVQEGKRPRLEHFPSTSSSSNMSGYSPHSPSSSTAIFLGRSHLDSSSNRHYPSPPRGKIPGSSTPTAASLQSPGGSGSPGASFQGTSSTSPTHDTEGWSRPSVPRGSLESVLRPPSRPVTASEDEETPTLPPISATSQVTGTGSRDKPPPMYPPLTTPTPALPSAGLDTLGGNRSGQTLPSGVPTPSGPKMPWPGSPEGQFHLSEAGDRSGPPGGSAAGLGGMSGLSILSRASDLAKGADKQGEGRTWPQK